MVGIKVENYEHFNRAMGKHITSKRHYQEEMKKGGFVPFEEAESIANKAQRESHKDYEPSEKLLNLVSSVKCRADKKGKVKLSDRQIEAMQSIGVNFKPNKNCQDLSTEKGGFSK